MPSSKEARAMRTLVAAGVLAVVVPVASWAQSPSPSPPPPAPEPAVTAAAPPPPRDPGLPAGEETAKAALDGSPRHGEYVEVPVAGGTPLRTWVVYPERKDKAGVGGVIH